MKVIILSDGNSIHTFRWAKSLFDNNIDVEIFSIFELDSSNKTKYSKLGIKTFSAYKSESSFNKYSGYTKKLNYFFALKKIKKHIKSFKPDILHAHYASSYGILAALSGFRPFYISVWGDDVFLHRKNYLIRMLIKFALNKASNIFSTSKTIDQLINQDYNKKTIIIPFGVDTSKFKSQNKKSLDPIVIGIIKSLEPHNGIEYLIESFKILLNKKIKNIELIIIGEGSNETKLKLLVQKYNINDKITFLGQIDHSRTVELYNRISIFVCPSIRESFGVSVIEASSCQLPIIANNIGGLKEVVKNGETGYLIDTSNINLLADKIEVLINNHNLIEEFGNNGRKFVKENFEWKTNVKDLIRHYHDHAS